MPKPHVSTQHDSIPHATPAVKRPRPTGMRARDAETTREEILRAATEEFAAKGLTGARVEEIASRTATSKHMIYYYFGSKNGLYSAALARAYEDFRAAESATEYDILSPPDALTALSGNTFDAHVANPHVVRILMAENINGGRHADGVDHLVQRRLVLETTQGILDRGVAAGTFRPGIDALQFHLSISSLSFFYVANQFTFGRVFDYDMAAADNVAKRRAEVIDMMVRYCAA